MEDPFVKRMMERTKARNKVLGRVTETEKEGKYVAKNSTEESVQNIVVGNHNNQGQIVAAVRPKDIAAGDEKHSLKKKVPFHATSEFLGASSQSEVVLPQSAPSSRKRYNKLALVSQRLEEWEDDYTYRSVCRDISEKVESKIVKTVHAAGNVVANAVDNRITLLNSQLSKFTPSKSYSNNSPKSKYYFGEAASNVDVEENLSFLNGNVPVAHSYQSPSNTSYHTAKSSISTPSPKSYGNFSVSSPMPLNAKETPFSKCMLQSKQNTPSPTKQLAWDKQLIKSLEAQGFTPSESRSRLSYDFERDRSPLKEKSQMPSSVSIDTKTDMENQPPKIISYIAKSPGSSPRKKRQNIANSPSQNRSRDLSPSKVSDLRSRWEQHIKDSSPERLQENVSPSRKNNLTSSSGKLSPSKNVAEPPYFSPTKSHPILPNVKHLVHCKPSKSSGNIAATSPKLKTNNIVKSAIKMPDTIPLIENPFASSVKDKIAAFSSHKGPAIIKKDPAEMSVQDRKNIFETRKGGAIIPKAPFGQNASSKALQSGSSSAHEEASKLKEKVVSSKSNKTYVCQPTSKQGNDQIDITGSKSFETQKKHFDFNHDDKWRATDINSEIMEERKQEMQILRNRFIQPQHKITPVLQISDETESEYPQSDESSSEFEIPTCGPPKPPRVVAESLNSISTPQIVVNGFSPSKRMNSTELGESCSPSPRRKEYVPKVKPGCLFPSLSDIESHSEAVDSQDEDDLKESSFAESILTSASIDSLGKHIQIMAKTADSYNSAYSDDFNSLIPGDSALEAIAEIDYALDEAFSDDEPTPPKRRKEKDNLNSFKTPKIKDDSDSSDNFQENSLAHSISMYRKQKPIEVNYTPVRQLIRKSHLDSPNIESPISPSVDISARIRVLQEEEELQLTVISQASSAINCVTQNPEQQGTPQHVEAEKLLLMATKKRQAALDEIQRLKAEGALGKRNHWTQDEDSCRGSISISNIALPLKQSFINKELREHAHHLLVLVRHRDQVITSQMQKTPGSIIEGAISFPNLMSLHNLSADFNISLEVYSFKVDMNKIAQHKKDFKKEHSRMILTPLKRLQKETRMSSPAMQSPGGPYSVRSSSFALIGFANLNINTLTRNAWTLEKVPYASPLDGHLLMRVSVSMEGGVIERSFLTMFEDVGGFGAWNRRWCVLSGPFLRYWSYPDDETKKECLGHLDLRMCTTRKVELVSRDVCARQFTFELTTVRPATKYDKTDLVHEVRNNTLISRILISADSKEERILWCNKLNKALANTRAWDPDALRPEDYHV